VRVGAKRRIMCGLAALLAVPALGSLAAGSASAATSADDLDPVDVVEVSGLFDRIVAENIETAVERAQSNGSQAVILQLNSKGAVIGRDQMAEVMEVIRSSKVPVAVWVGPSGARAYGLPAQLLAVADVTAMAPGARVGRTGTLLKVNNEVISFGSEQADDAIHSDTLGFLDAREQKILKFSTDDRGVPVLRNMLFALDGISARGTTLDTVVDALDAEGQVTREATTVRFFKLGLMPRLLHTVASPPSAYLLLTIGVALLIFEFFTAGIGIAGLVGAVTLILGGLGIGALPMNGLGVALFLLSMVAFAVDVQVGVPRFWTGVGLFLYVIGSFTMFRSVDGLSLRPSWLTLSVCIVGIALTFIVGMPSMTRTRFATPTIGRTNLVGTTGVTVGEVAPEGIVLVDGAQWRARTNRATPLAASQQMRVVDIDGITLIVEPLEGGARDYREGRRSG
jgi:membrane-bound serine protease (ClpP class)